MGDRGGPMRKFKVVLLGEGRVGKTSILLRYIKGEYDDRQVSTLQASYLDKRMMVDNNKVQLSLWDTAGQERFHALGPIYYRDADGALLVYDITDDESFKKVRTWVKELRRIVGDDIDITIAGNKSDLTRNRKVKEEDARQYAESVGATHVTTSAKLNKGLEEAFVELTKRMLLRTASKKKKSTLIADEDEGPPLDIRASAPGSRGGPRSGNTVSTRASESSGGRVGRGGDRGTSQEQEIPPRSRKGGRGNGITITNDDSDAEGESAPSQMVDGVRIRGASQHQKAQIEATKAKASSSGCC